MGLAVPIPLLPKVTPSDILSSRYRLQVGRIDTCRVPAEVIDIQSFRYRPNEKFINDSMSSERLLT